MREAAVTFVSVTMRMSLLSGKKVVKNHNQQECISSSKISFKMIRKYKMTCNGVLLISMKTQMQMTMMAAFLLTWKTIENNLQLIKVQQYGKQSTMKIASVLNLMQALSRKIMTFVLKKRFYIK
jgi:hypothetical protein